MKSKFGKGQNSELISFVKIKRTESESRSTRLLGDFFLFTTVTTFYIIYIAEKGVDAGLILKEQRM